MAKKLSNKPVRKLEAEDTIQMSPEEVQAKQWQEKLQRTYDNAKRDVELKEAAIAGAQAGARDGASLDPLAAAKERYLGGEQKPVAPPAPVKKPAAQGGFYQDDKGRRLPMAYLDLTPDQKQIVDEKLAGEEQSKSDGALALESSAMVLDLQERSNVAQRELADKVAALEGRLGAMEESDQELTVELEGEATQEAKRINSELAQAGMRAADIGTRLDDQSRRAERTADELDASYQQIIGQLEADKIALKQEVDSLKGTVKFNQELFVENQSTLQQMKEQLNNQLATQKQLDSLLASSQTVGSQKKTVDLAISEAEMVMEKIMFSTPGFADIRAVLGLNMSSVLGWIAQIDANYQANLISASNYEKERNGLEGLRQMLLRNEDRFTQPGMAVNGDPLMHG